MVSWTESSEDSAAQYISSCGSPVQIPATTEDSNYAGVEDDSTVMCEHGKPAVKRVAFEGISTGRRFLACSLDEASSCGIVQWVDEEWPEQLQNALHKLWIKYEQSQHDNRMACLDHSHTVHNLTEEKKKLQENYEKLVEDVNNLLNSQDNIPQPHVDSSMANQDEQHVAKDAEITKLKAVVDQLKSIHVAQANCIINMKHNHLKEKEKMSTDNRTLKFCWADLKKEKEKMDGCIAELMTEKEKWRIEKSIMEGCIAELMKDKEKWSIEKSTMECSIADLKKAGQNNKRKLKEIKAICDEE